MGVSRVEFFEVLVRLAHFLQLLFVVFDRLQALLEVFLSWRLFATRFTICDFLAFILDILDFELVCALLV